MNDAWKLERLEISHTICHHKIVNDSGREEWGGGYNGSISFQNGDRERFKVNITEPQMEHILDVIRESVIDSAETMANKIKESLKKEM